MRLGCRKFCDAELGEFEFIKRVFFDDGFYLFFGFGHGQDDAPVLGTFLPEMNTFFL